MGILKDAEAQGLRLLDDMSGRPSMAKYKEQGFEIITFKSFYSNVFLITFYPKPICIFAMGINIINQHYCWVNEVSISRTGDQV